VSIQYAVRLQGFALAAVITAFGATSAQALETKSYAIEWFSLGSYSQEGDCVGGVNPPTRDQYAKSFELLGYSPDQVKKLMDDYAGEDDIAAANARDKLRMRGRINGEPVNAFVHPWAVTDPKLKGVTGQYSFGFNLDGKAGASSFTEPRTKEKGIDNQLFRALGCIEQFRGTFNFRPTFWDFIWGSMKETIPAWLMTVSGEDLDKDGPVTITFDRAVEQLVFGPGGDVVADTTYRADPDPRSHHVFKGEIKDKQLVITEHGNLQLLLDTLSFTEFRLSNTHLTMAIEPSGRLNGFIGGYQPWGDIYFGLAQGGLAYEGMIINDIPGVYYLMKRYADAQPDKSGQNQAISAAYHIEAVPVFVVPADQAQ
jgi:hypothetical protein